MRMGKVSSVAEYRMDEQFQNLPIFGISMVFQIKKIEACQNLLIFQFGKFPIRKIPKIFNLRNNSHPGTIPKFANFWNFDGLSN